MKIVKEIFLIWAVSVAGELLNRLLPLPIPTGIYGLLLMLLLLCSGVLKLEQVEHVGFFLVEIMPIMFVTSAAGLVQYWSSLRAFLLPFLLAVTVVTWIVMAVVGLVAQRLTGGGKPHG